MVGEFALPIDKIKSVVIHFVSMDELTAYQIWLKKQKELEPILPIRYMSELAKIAPNTVQKYLKRLVEMGLAQEVPFGEDKVQYRMIDNEPTR